MIAHSRIHPAGPADAHDISFLVGGLLHEITNTARVQAFHFYLDETTVRLGEFLQQTRYFTFLARENEGRALRFITLCKSYALYAEGRLGILPKLYVHPEYRSRHSGHRLLAQGTIFGAARGWKHLRSLRRRCRNLIKPWCFINVKTWPLAAAAS